MRVYSICFSPTGGTRRAADALCGGWPCQVEPVDLSDPKWTSGQLSLTAEDVCLVAAPSFGGRVPGIAAERLAAMRGNGARAVLLCAYGNRDYDDTLLELSDVLEQAGFRCRAAVAAVAEHSILRQFAAGRPDSRDCGELAAFGKSIWERLQEDAGAPALPGNRPYRPYGGVPMKPKAGGGCNRCGLCAAGCPVGAIDREDPRKTDADGCISCMRCVAICPRQARKVNALMKAAAGQKLKQVCAGRKDNELFL